MKPTCLSIALAVLVLAAVSLGLMQWFGYRQSPRSQGIRTETPEVRIAAPPVALPSPTARPVPPDETGPEREAPEPPADPPVISLDQLQKEVPEIQIRTPGQTTGLIDMEKDVVTTPAGEEMEAQEVTPEEFENDPVPLASPEQDRLTPPIDVQGKPPGN